MSKQARCAALLAALLLCSHAIAAQDVDLQWGVKIPLRDGVELAATVYRPAGQKEPLPVIFTLTPYIGDTYHPRALYFARNGYVFALVDARAGDAFHSGSLSEATPSGPAKPDTWVYDPLDVRPAEMEKEPEGKRMRLSFCFFPLSSSAGEGQGRGSWEGGIVRPLFS